MPRPERSVVAEDQSRRVLLGRSVWLGLGLLVGAVVSHFGYWYVPRARPAFSSQSDLRSLITDRDFELWIPFPHQNLPILAEWIEDPVTFVPALVSLAGGDPTSVPSLGPFGVPPASEVVLAANRGGASPVAAVRPYPTVRFLARASGWLADNPWLAGGRIETGGGSLAISWHGGVWVASPEDLTVRADGDRSADHGVGRQASKALAQLTVRAPDLEVPSGGYGLRQYPGRLVLRTEQVGRDSVPDLSALSSIRGLSILRLETGREQLMIFGGESRRGELPSAVAIGRTRDRAFAALPGAKILGRVSDLPTRQVGGFVLVATDERGLSLALEGRSFWESLCEQALSGRLGGFWVQLDSAERIASGLADLLEDVPIVSPARARRWRDIQVVLSGLSRFGVASAWWTSEDAVLTLE